METHPCARPLPPSQPTLFLPSPGALLGLCLGSDSWPRALQPLGFSRGVGLLPEKARTPAQAPLTSEGLAGPASPFVGGRL